jgi:hypothetical protein
MNFYVPTFRNTLFHLHRSCKFTRPIKMELTGCSKTSIRKIQTPGNHPKERIKDSNKISMSHQCLNEERVNLCPYHSSLLRDQSVVLCGTFRLWNF